MVRIMTIINVCLLIAVGFMWYLQRPLASPETWIAPGHIVKIDDFINAEPISKVKNISLKTNLHMTYVREVEVTTRWNRFALNLDGYELRNTNSHFSSSDTVTDFTKNDLNILGKKLVPFMKHDIIKAAMVYHKIEWEEKISRPIVIHHPEKFQTGVPLQVGDEIIELNGEPIESTDDIYFFLKSFHIGDTVTVKVQRKGNIIRIPIEIKEMDSSGRATLGVYLKHQFTFDGLNDDDVIQLDRTYIGESGGFILTLGLIQKLEPSVDLSKGRIIAGTGGITRGGDIKPIGNLDLKVLTAVNENADVFFYPKFQEAQIEEVRKAFSIGDIELIGVRNISEAIKYLTET